MPKHVARQRKHKVLARQKQQGEQDGDAGLDTDPNAIEILPVEAKAKEERKLALRAEARRESEVAGKMSGKKRKRLEKYIDTKLKREENLALLKKLAAQKVDTRLFQSSKKLGRGEETKKEKLRRTLAESRAGVDVEKNSRLFLERRVIREVDDSGEESDEEKQSAGRDTNSTYEDRQIEAKTKTWTRTRERSKSPGPTQDSVSTHQLEKPLAGAELFGIGLKRPLELGEDGRPIMQTRKRRKVQSKPIPVSEVEAEWEGISLGAENEADHDESEDDGSALGSSQSHEDSDEDNDSETGSEELEDETEYASESDSSSDQDEKAVRKERSSAFKTWATQQRNEAIGFTPTNNLTHAIRPKPADFKPREIEQDPLPPELETKTKTDATRKAYSVTVERTPEIQEARLQLPVVAEEQRIMETVHNNDVVVVWGATGSGKTTQVPQFLYEAGYGAPDGPTPGMIGITQPRRVAAVSMSARVGDELGSDKARVAYQIRFDTSTSAKTAMKFMTDGILLREISQDFLLDKYSAIVIDEAHERSVNTDILIGMLSRIVDLRADMARKDPNCKPLKLIIMSATLRVSDFTENKRLFRAGPPPLLKAEGRQYAVTNHFARRTQRDYVDEIWRKVCRGHRKLPRGGMLVFLTGQNEITHLAKKLRQAFSSTQGQEVKAGNVVISPADAPLETEDLELNAKSHDVQDDDGSDSEDSVIIEGLDEEEEEEDEQFEIEGERAEEKELKVHVLPLYSQLPTNQQLRVFEPPPEGSRLIVLATNVAETSLTIPGIRYVFDCGRAKEKKYDLVTGVQSFEVGWISKASADQRAGRAGRTGPGHCYRLFSSAVFERDFADYAEPEIMRTPLEGVVLQLKSMGAPVVNFPFPTPPDRQHLRKAEDLLSYLGALSAEGKVTKLGHELSLYPLNPRFARMLAMGVAQNLTAETIALVAAMSVPELIIPENKLGLRDPPLQHLSDLRTEQDNLGSEERSRLRKAYNAAQAKLSVNAKQSDCIKLNNAICAYAHEAHPEAFCEDMFLNYKGMREASQLRQQLTSIVRAHRPTAIGSYQAKLSAPSSEAIDLLMQICAAGFIDQVAMRADLAPVPPDLSRKPRTAVEVPYVTLFPSQLYQSRSDDPHEKYVYLHPSSILARTAPAKLPGYIVYSHLQRATPSSVDAPRVPKTRFHALTPITRPQLINIALGTPLLQVSKPKGLTGEISRQGGSERRVCEVEMSLVGAKGGQGWGLGVRRVSQVRDSKTKSWTVERLLG